MKEEINDKPKPGYFTDKPYLKHLRKIKKLIGIQDASLQTNQLAILFLEENVNSSKNSELFLKELFDKHKVSRGTYDLSQFKNTIYKSYILQTYNLVEPSLKKLNKFYRYYNNFEGNWKTKNGDKNLDPFNQLIINLDSKSRKEIKSYPEYYLMDYYRLVRNSIVHLQNDKNEHSITIQYYNDLLQDKIEYFNYTYELSAPNIPTEITFEDFMIYTRAIKYFINIINNVCFPKIENLVIAASKDDILQKRLYACRHIQQKGVLGSRINALHSYFNEHFGNKHKEIGREFCRQYLTYEGIDYTGYLQ